MVTYRAVPKVHVKALEIILNVVMLNVQFSQLGSYTMYICEHGVVSLRVQYQQYVCLWLHLKIIRWLFLLCALRRRPTYTAALLCAYVELFCNKFNYMVITSKRFGEDIYTSLICDYGYIQIRWISFDVSEGTICTIHVDLACRLY